MLFWGHDTLLVNAYVAYKCHMDMEGEVPMYHYDFSKEIVLAKVDPFGNSAPTQSDYFAVQRNDPRAMSRMIKKRKDRYTTRRSRPGPLVVKGMQLSRQMINDHQKRRKWEPMLLITLLALNRLE